MDRCPAKKNRARVGARTRQDAREENLSHENPSADRGGRNSHAYVYDGQQCLGHVLARGKTDFEAFDRDDRPLGPFPNTASSSKRAPDTEGAPRFSANKKCPATK